MTDLLENVRGFRVQRKKFGMTWSCPVDCDDNPIESKEEVKEFLQDLLGTGEYTIGEELHESGKRHYHAYYNADNAFESKNPRVFDLKGVHPNILKPKKYWVAYCAKHTNYITNHYEECPYKEMYKKRTWEEAQEYILNKKPRDFALYGKRLKENWEMVNTPPRTSVVYCGPYKPFPSWDKSKSLVLTGKAGMGKTQHAKWYCAQNGGFYYVKGRMDKLKHYDGSPWIIFDDIVIPDNWKQWDINALVDVENGGELPFRYGNADIPGGVMRIFITNGQLCLPDQYGDVARRIEHVTYV